MPLTENPPTAAEGEITPEQQTPRSRGNLPQALIDKINATAKLPGDASASTEPAPAPTPVEKPADTPAATATPAPTTPTPAPEPAKQAELKGTKAVREALERAEKRAKDLEESVNATAKEKAEAFAKVATLQEELTTTRKRIAEDLEPRAKLLEEKEKELQAAQDHLRMVDYTKSQQWHKDYVQPIADAQQEAAQLLAELVVPTGDGSERPATQADFNHVMSAPTLNEAARRAKELFGDFATPQVVNLRSRLSALQKKQSEALKNAHAESMEWHKQQQALRAQAEEQFRNTLHQRESHYETGWRPADDDAELRAAYLEGQELADLATVGKPGMTREQLADAAGRARALVKKAFVADKRMARLEKENAELREQLTRYQKSEPDVETRTHSAQQSGDMSHLSNEQARELMRQNLLKRAREIAVQGSNR